MISFMNIACTTCAQAFEHAGDNAAGYAILFMLAVIIPVLGAIGFCITRIARRQQQHLEPQFADSQDA